jgi:hypothetical protein
MQTKNQQVDISFLNMFQDGRVRLSHADECMWLTYLASVMGQDGLNSAIEMLLKPKKLLRVVDVARMNDIQNVQV